MAKSLVWLITGASSGFGRALAEEALSRGDRVVATVRDPKALAGLAAQHEGRVHAIALDVTKAAQIEPAVKEAIGEQERAEDRRDRGERAREPRRAFGDPSPQPGAGRDRPRMQRRLVPVGCLPDLRVEPHPTLEHVPRDEREARLVRGRDEALTEGRADPNAGS